MPYCFKKRTSLPLRLSSHFIRNMCWLNTLRPRQNGRRFPDDIFKCIFVNKNAWILIKISLKFVPLDPINNIPSLVQIMAWCRPGNKSLSEPMMVSLMAHICIAWHQWVNTLASGSCACKIKWVIFKLISRIDISCISFEIALRWMPKTHWLLVNIGSGNGLVLSGNKPLPEPMLTRICVTIWCH